MCRAHLPLTEPFIVLVGPTAVGKTAFSLPLARVLNAEIVNVDSRQLYRLMDIGTAKPTPAQRQQVPHHLLDLLLPDQISTAAQFASMAMGVLADIQRREKRVLLVGGSGLYLRALLYGLMPVPAADAALRQELHAYADRYGTPALHQRLQQLDPLAAQQYHAHDRVRLVRALEIAYLTGEPFSTHQQRHQPQQPLHPYVGIALTRAREELYARIAERTDTMLAAGWLQEVETLLACGYTAACAAMNSLGYRELLTYLAGQTTWGDTVTAIKRHTRRFAKRQLTWFRKFPQLQWFNISGLAEETAVATVLDLLQQHVRYPQATRREQPCSSEA
jgi:tRNA dimethylallyltransferase